MRAAAWHGGAWGLGRATAVLGILGCAWALAMGAVIVTGCPAAFILSGAVTLAVLTLFAMPSLAEVDF